MSKKIRWGIISTGRIARKFAKATKLESFQIMKTMDGLRAEWGFKYPFES